MESSQSRQQGGGGIALTVTPKSSAFFSGETLEFAITFKNTRPRQYYYSSSSTSNSNHHQVPSARHPYQQHGKHLSTSSINLASLTSSSASVPSSAPPSRSAFAHHHHHHHHHQQHHSLSSGTTPTPSPSRSYADLSAFASPDNRSGDSSHIVLPERKGIIGTPLGLASTSTSTSTSASTSTPTTSPTQHLRRPNSFNHHHLTPPNSLPRPSPSDNYHASTSTSLYPSKRLPSARHRKNDYSVAGITTDGDGDYLANGSLSSSSANDDIHGGGVSDLSSQLAGMAILQQREGSSGAVDEEAVMNAQPFVERYKRQGDALQSRYPSINTNGSWRSKFR